MKLKTKYFALLSMAITMPLAGICQVNTETEALKSTVTEFFHVYNAGDTALYRKYLKERIPDHQLEDKLKRFGNTWNSIGTIDVKKLMILDKTHAEALVQERRYGAWWRFTVMTDSNQKFINRTVMPAQMPSEGLRSGVLSRTEISDSVTSYIQERLKNDFAGNVFISKDNRPIYSRSFGNGPDGKANTYNTVFGLASSAKMFTAIAILQLKEKHALTLKDKVSLLIPELKNPVFKTITIEQLLTHTSGMGDFFEDPSYREGITNMEDPSTLNSFIEKSELLFPPGTDFRYSNTGYLLLGLIIERVSGRDFKSYIKDRIFNIAKMESSGPGTGAGGGKSTVNDLVRFFTALKGNSLLPKNTTHEFMVFHTKNNYGYGSEHHLLGSEHIVGHSGGFINECIELNFYSKSKNLVIILSNSNPPFGHFLSNKIKELLIRRP